MTHASTTPTGLASAWHLRPFAAVVAGVALCAALAGCGHNPVDPYETTGTVPQDYRTSHPILIEEQIETIDIPVSAGAARLSEEARSNVTFFAQGFARSGASLIAVIAPSGSPNQDAAAAAAVEIEEVLRRAGIAASAIDYRVYQASAEERIAPVRLAYNRIAAHTAPCRPWSDQVTVTAQNKHYGAYGCASQQNLAAMVTNPLDLLYPRGLTPPDAARRANVIRQYQGGLSPGSGGATSTSGGGQ